MAGSFVYCAHVVARDLKPSDPLTPEEKTVIQYMLEKSARVAKSINRNPEKIGAIMDEEGYSTLPEDDQIFLKHELARGGIAKFSSAGTQLKVETLDNARMPISIDVDLQYLLRGSINVGGYWTGYDVRKLLRYNFETYLDRALRDYKKKQAVSWRDIVTPLFGIVLSLQGCDAASVDNARKVGVMTGATANLGVQCALAVSHPTGAIIGAAAAGAGAVKKGIETHSIKEGCKDFYQHAPVLSGISGVVNAIEVCRQCSNNH